jgi:hypothetical protein
VTVISLEGWRITPAFAGLYIKRGVPRWPPAEYASPRARRVYDLSHACVSTWLNGGVPPAQVAEWAGHSVAVLLRVYAKCIDGQDQIAKRRIEDALRESDDQTVPTDGDEPQF